MLYGKDVLFQRAEELEIFSFKDEAKHIAARLIELQAETPIKVTLLSV